MWLVILAALSGAIFTLMGVAFQLGRPRGVRPLQIILVCCVVSVVVFGGYAAVSESHDLPALLIWCAVLAGVTQYICARLVRFILHHGPLSPLICSVSLAFVPGTIYAVLFLSEPSYWTTWAGILAGVLCVLAGARQQHPPEEVKHIEGSRGLYAFALLGIFLANSVSYIVLKHLSAQTLASGENCLDAYRHSYLTVFYACIGLPIVLDLWFTKQFRAPLRPWLALGLLAAVGSMGGMWLLALTAKLPGPVVFTLSNISQIVAGSTVSVLFFRERVSWAWYAMLILGVAAVALVNLHAAL
jgi:drug/metabolite transporter (DMT)-like permease